MGMPVILQLPNDTLPEIIEAVFERLIEIDQQYSPYIKTSEVYQLNDGSISHSDISAEYCSILDLAESVRQRTDGFFDIAHRGKIDPTGIVKGWAIQQAADIVHKAGIENFIIDIAGDMICAGMKDSEHKWAVGIRAPLEPTKVVKQLQLSNAAIATSGATERGQHIYNPKSNKSIEDILSISVIGPDIIWADVYATAAFAMGRAGIEWIESLSGYEGFAILPDMTGISTTGLTGYQS